MTVDQFEVSQMKLNAVAAREKNTANTAITNFCEKLNAYFIRLNIYFAKLTEKT